MSGRGDHNKKGTSGQGASNQSNEAFVADDQKQPKSNHNKEDKITGGKPSQPQAATEDQDTNRDHSTEGQERKYN
jgi:hypothetical protein